MWMEMFPDPLNSPACYTKTLFINCLQGVRAEDVEAGAGSEVSIVSCIWRW